MTEDADAVPDVGTLDFEARAPGVLDEHEARPRDVLLACACGGAYLHPFRIDVDRGGAVTRVTCSGAEELRREGSGARGVVTDVWYACEEGGCLLVVRTVFHKGQVLSYVAHVPDAFDEDRVAPPVLYRD